MSDFLIHKSGDEYALFKEASRELQLTAASANEAFDAALSAIGTDQPGHIQIGSGIFTIKRPIKLGSHLSVSGAGRGTVLQLESDGPEASVFYAESADAVTLTDMTLDGGDRDSSFAGVVFHECGDCEIRGVSAKNFAGYGFLLRKDSFLCKLIGNTTSANGKAGTCLLDSDQGRGGDWVFNLVSECVSVGDLGHAFEISFSFCTNLVGCQAYQPGGHGFYITRHSNSTCLTGCRVYQGYRSGVVVEDSHEINISSNIICWNREHGIVLSNLLWGTVSANNVIDNGGRVAPQMHGIYLHSGVKTVQVTANAIFNWPGHLPMIDGIHETADCEYNQITDNNISFYTGDAVVCQGKESVALNNLGNAEAYEHPGDASDYPIETVNGKVIPKPGEPFNRDRVEAFLKKNRL